MTEIIPFQGITYNPAGIPLSKVIAPPADTITPEKLTTLLEQHPQNITWMIYPQADSSAVESVRIFQEWSSEGVLLTEKNPVIYVVEQIFRTSEGKQQRRRGFIALWKFDDQTATINQSLTRSLDWIGDTGIWPTPLVVIYDDSTRRIDRYISYAVRSVPVVDVTADDVRTTMWKLNEGGAIAGIIREIREKHVGVTGDGTDISTACALRSAHPHHAGPEPYNYVSTLFVNAGEPGLVSVPMHRICTFHREFSTEDIKSRLGQIFTLTELEDRNELIIGMAQYGSHAVGIGFSGEHRYSLAVLKEPVDYENPDGAIPIRYALKLFDDVIRTINGNGSDTLKVRYTSDTVKVWNALESSEAQVVCFANPTPVETIVAALSSRLPIPEGIIDFYPHLPLGLVLQTFHE